MPELRTFADYDPWVYVFRWYEKMSLEQQTELEKRYHESLTADEKRRHLWGMIDNTWLWKEWVAQGQPGHPTRSYCD